MKSSLRKLVFGLVGLVPFVALKSPLASEPRAANQVGTQAGATVPAAAVDPDTLNDYQNLINADFGISSDIIELNYHDESQTVDLSTFDGHTVTVPIHTMHTGSPNGEGGT
jgi:hypothetical protein